VLLENDDRHAGTRQEPAQHHAGGTAARNGALDAHGPSLQDRGSRLAQATGVTNAAARAQGQ
jgi:hypothetical protein